MTVQESSIASAAPVRKKITGHVGFSNLPNQVRRKSVKDGFQLTVMVVGAPVVFDNCPHELTIRHSRRIGLGQVYTDQYTFQLPDLHPARASTSGGGQAQDSGDREYSGWFVGLLCAFIRVHDFLLSDIEENGVRLRLTVVDTPGFGDFVNNRTRYERISRIPASCKTLIISTIYSWDPILETVEQRFEAYLSQEHRVRRAKLVDNRVHACIYFIQPTGHSCVFQYSGSDPVELMKSNHITPV
jgi:septin 7